MSAFGTIIQIGDILVSEDVVLEYFACDYGRCKGCCCVIGDRLQGLLLRHRGQRSTVGSL